MRITSWNLQGRQGLDLDAVASTLVRLDADVVVLQEVQRAQAAALADRLRWRCRWWLKHWSIVHPPEGLAILSASPLADAARIHLAHRWRVWSWRRRIAVLGVVGGVTVVDIHLGAGVGGLERVRQARLVLAAVADTEDVVIGGDFNAAPGSDVLAAFAAEGFRDAWKEIHGSTDYATNWRRGVRSGPPGRRLDYVVIRGALTARDAMVGDAAAPDWTRLADLSDHAPITITVDRDRRPGPVQ